MQQRIISLNLDQIRQEQTSSKSSRRNASKHGSMRKKKDDRSRSISRKARVVELTNKFELDTSTLLNMNYGHISRKPVITPNKFEVEDSKSNSYKRTNVHTVDRRFAIANLSQKETTTPKNILPPKPKASVRERNVKVVVRCRPAFEDELKREMYHNIVRIEENSSFTENPDHLLGDGSCCEE